MHLFIFFSLVYTAPRFDLYFSVDELPLVEVELKKANCREKAVKVGYYIYAY